MNEFAFGGFANDEFSDWQLSLDTVLSNPAINDEQLISNLTVVQRKFMWVPHSKRVAAWRPRAHGVIQLLNSEREAPVHEACWDVLISSIKLHDQLQRDPSAEENDTLDFGVEIGLLEQIAKELKRRPVRTRVASACLVALANISLAERHASRVLQNGLVQLLLDIVRIRRELPQIVPLLSLIALANIAIHADTHKALLEEGAITVATELLPFLSSSAMDELDMGLSAAFLICRVSGRDEVGAGSESIHSNQDFMDKLYWIFERVLAAGPRGIVLGSHWNPANIVLDISILAESDRNKPLLARFVPLLVVGLASYGSMNVRLTKFTLRTLLQLHFHEDTRRAMGHVKHRLLHELQKKYITEKGDIETFQVAATLTTALQATPVTMKIWMLGLYDRVSFRITDALRAF